MKYYWTNCICFITILLLLGIILKEYGKVGDAERIFILIQVIYTYTGDSIRIFIGICMHVEMHECILIKNMHKQELTQNTCICMYNSVFTNMGLY